MSAAVWRSHQYGGGAWYITGRDNAEHFNGPFQSLANAEQACRPGQRERSGTYPRCQCIEDGEQCANAAYADDLCSGHFSLVSSSDSGGK